MRGSKKICLTLVIVLLTLLSLILQCKFGVSEPYRTESPDMIGSDIRCRRNEIICAHTGLNPLNVFNHTVASAQFQGIHRPDFPNEVKDRNKLPVHCYPPWHLAFCWWYAWIPLPIFMGMVSLAYGLGLSITILWLRRCLPMDTDDRAVFVSLICLFLSVPLLEGVFMSLNYGIVGGCLLLFMCWCLKKQYDVLGGIAWALIMCKPQVGLLLFFPLFFGKRYKVIVVAITACMAGTGFMAWVYDENMMTLIRQLPEIGAPYSKGFLCDRVFTPLLGKMGPIVGMVTMFLFSGLLSFQTRSIYNWGFRFAVPLFVLPYWTYAGAGDRVVQIVAFVLIADMVIAWINRCDRNVNVALAMVLVCIGITIFKLGWGHLVQAGLLNPAGIGWIYRLVALPMELVTPALYLLGLKYGYSVLINRDTRLHD